MMALSSGVMHSHQWSRFAPLSHKHLRHREVPSRVAYSSGVLPPRMAGAHLCRATAAGEPGTLRECAGNFTRTLTARLARHRFRYPRLPVDVGARVKQ